MKMYDPRRADQRTLPEKLVGLIAAASEEDIAEVNGHLKRLAARKSVDLRFKFQIPKREKENANGTSSS